MSARVQSNNSLNHVLVPAYYKETRQELRGSPEAIRYALRDRATLDYATALAPGRGVAVQAGGNLGIFADHLSTKFAAVYTFEPDPGCFEKMCANLRDRHNVIKIQAALGNERGMVRTETTRRDAGDGKSTRRPVHDGLTHVASGPGIIPVLRVDDLALPRCDLLVLDLEGYELHALVGAIETVRRHRPVIMCEVSRFHHFYDHEAEDVRTWIRMRGYELSARMHSDEVWVPAKRSADQVQLDNRS